MVKQMFKNPAEPMIYFLLLMAVLVTISVKIKPPPPKVVSPGLISSSSSSYQVARPAPIIRSFPAPGIGAIISFQTTGYCPCEICCGEWADGIYADGSEVGGLAIAAGPSYPFGTKIIVPGYGTARVKDRGSAITEYRLDLYFKDHQTALEWGNQQIICEVYYDSIEKGPDGKGQKEAEEKEEN